MAIIGVSGKIGSGKDTIGKIIIAYKRAKVMFPNSYLKNDFIEVITSTINSSTINSPIAHSDWQIKKFAGKLKQITALLIGCKVEDLEDQEFKSSPLGKEWSVASMVMYQEQEVDNIHFLTPREILQKLGTECGRNIIHPNIWVNALFADYRQCLNGCDNSKYIDDPNGCENNSNCKFLPDWIITDVRFPNEAEAILNRQGILIRVNRFPDILHHFKGDFGVPDSSRLEKFDPLNSLHLELYMGNIQIQHSSETSLDTYEKFNHTINNDGSIDDLVIKVREILIKEKII